MISYEIRKVSTGELVSAWEGEDGHAEASRRVRTHNALWPNDQWFIVKEL